MAFLSKNKHKPTGLKEAPPQKTLRRWRSRLAAKRYGRLDLWNAGRGTLVGPGMEAVLDPPRYGSSVAWLGGGKPVGLGESYRGGVKMKGCRSPKEVTMFLRGN